MEVDPVTAKALRLDMQFCPSNKRTIEVLSPMIQQRMHEWVIMTDCWKAYQQVARDAMDCKPQKIF